MAEHPGDGRIVEARPVVKNFYQQRSAAIGIDGERIIRLAAEAELAAGPRATLRAQRRVPRRVLKIEDGFKERRAARHAGPALDIYQRRVLVRAKGDPGGSQVLQPRQQARLRDDANPDRHGVDKKPADRFGPLNRGTAAGTESAPETAPFAPL